MNEQRKKRLREIGGTVVWVALIICIIIFLFLRFSAVWEVVQKVIGVLSPFFIGLILCYLANPIFNRIRRFFVRKKMKKGAAGAIASVACVLLVIIVIYGIFALVIPKLYESVQSLVKTVSPAIESGDWTQLIPESCLKYKDEIVAAFSSIENITGDFFNEVIMKAFSENYEAVLGGILSSVSSILKFLYNFLIGIIAMVYLLNNKDHLVPLFKRLIYSMAPKKADIFCYRIRQFNTIFGGFISGKLLDSLIIGILCFIVTTIFRIPYALLVSVIVGITNIIPFFGPIIGGVPSALIIFIQSPQKGIIFAIIIILLQQLDGNLIGPKILGNSLGITGLSVLFSIIVGGGLFGFIGMLLAVPVWTFISAVINDTTKERLKKAGLPTDIESYERKQSPVRREEKPEEEAEPVGSVETRGASGEDATEEVKSGETKSGEA